MTKMEIVKHYFDEYGIKIPEHGKKEYTLAKEKVGEKIIAKYNLWNIYFPGYQKVKKAISKKNQKDEGIDFFITDEEGSVYCIDIKCVIGDYTYKAEEVWQKPEEAPLGPKSDIVIPIELTQNGVRTFLRKKKTDLLLYIVCNESGVYTYMLDYQDVLKYVDENIDRWVEVNNMKHKEINRGPFKHHTSFNKTGEYILVPVQATLLKNSFE